MRLQRWGCWDDELAGIAQPTSEGSRLFLLGLPTEDSQHLFYCQGCMAIHFSQVERNTHRALVICKTDIVVCKVHV